MVRQDTSGIPAVTPERMLQGAASAVSCLGIGADDRVVIITDLQRENIAHHVAEQAQARGATVTALRLEDYGQRPMTAFPDPLRADLTAALPTATFYIATAQPGEVTMRMGLLPYLTQELKVRHGQVKSQSFCKSASGVDGLVYALLVTTSSPAGALSC